MRWKRIIIAGLTTLFLLSICCIPPATAAYGGHSGSIDLQDFDSIEGATIDIDKIEIPVEFDFGDLEDDNLIAVLIVGENHLTEDINNFAIENTISREISSLLYSNATVNFFGDGLVEGANLYASFTFDWTGAKFSTYTVEALQDDNAASTVSIPATALLFCCSLVGFLGIRRMLLKKSNR